MIPLFGLIKCINIWYIYNRTLKLDLIILVCTLFNIPLDIESLIRKQRTERKGIRFRIEISAN